MKNAILDSALHELALLGIKPMVWRASKHYRIAWVYNGAKRVHTVPATPSDYRSAKNNRAQLRHILKKDGLLPARVEFGRRHKE